MLAHKVPCLFVYSHRAKPVSETKRSGVELHSGLMGETCRSGVELHSGLMAETCRSGVELHSGLPGCPRPPLF